MSVLASEEDDTAISVGSGDGQYVVVFDPLDGSRNIDAAIPTGDISGFCTVGIAPYSCRTAALNGIC